MDNVFHEDGKGGIFHENGESAAAYVVEPSFCLTKLTDLSKYIKNREVIAEVDEDQKDAEMTEAPLKKERTLSITGTLMPTEYFIFILFERS